ncbi:MAG: site-specific integrase [Butyricicoccus sp.]|nr:site-specific integrase [Butyricicoccus sp.]
MGKDLKGKKLGKGITQRKDDATYQARYVDKAGTRHQARFKTAVEARDWLDKLRYEDKFGGEIMAEDMTVDDWFTTWHTEIIKDLAPNTRRNYAERYHRNIQPVIGKLRLRNVKPIHCIKILNSMDDDYAGSTIRQTYITLGTMFKSAKMNGMIDKHPLDGVRFSKPVRAVDDIKFLTVDEQRRFLAAAGRSHNYYQYALLLETGLRTGEMIGLIWDNIDWTRRTLTVEKTLEFRHKQHFWRAGPPKTMASYRTIPLTNQAYEILRAVYVGRETGKQAGELNEVLEYMDKRTGETRTLALRDLVFINFRTGMPNKNSSYDTHLYKICGEAGIKRFCMHALRHTYATRAIESGMQPKTLQKLLGHASLKTTMDRYVHVTDDSLEAGVRQFEQGQRINALWGKNERVSAT